MVSGGEEIEHIAGGVTGWEGVAALADKMPEDEKAPVDGVDANMSLGELEEDYKRAVFEDVDLSEVEDLVQGFAEKIDLDDLNELIRGIEADTIKGIERAEDYFVDLLGLRVRPEIDPNFVGEDGDCGQHYVRAEDGQEVIEIATHRIKGSDEILETLAHENWHSYQMSVIKKELDDAKNGKDFWAYERAFLYAYNKKNYIRARVDYAGYRKQLYEAEAFAFGDKVKQKAKKAKVIAQYSEIYGEENELSIEREMQNIFGRMEVDAFLERMQLSNLDEFFAKTMPGADIEDFAQNYVNALSDLAGLESEIKVEFVDELASGMRGRVEYDEHKIILSRKNQNDMITGIIPRLTWAFRQSEWAMRHPDDERARLYRINRKNFITKDDPERFEKQLLMKEREEFANVLLQILDEQATLADIEMLPPAEQAEVREEQMRVGWEPRISQKYNVKRKKRDGREDRTVSA